MSGADVALRLAVEEESVGGGPYGLVILLLLLLATFLLIRNMNGRLKRLPREFPQQEDEDEKDPPTA